MPIDSLIFQEQFARFDRRVFYNSKPHQHFVSFREGFPDEIESYKTTLRIIARDRLAFDTWAAKEIGSGKILECVINAIEIHKGQNVPRNNLVAWQARYRPGDVTHRALLDALTDRSTRRQVERWCFEFFRNHAEPGEAFRSFVDLVGRRYDLVAYLFFLSVCPRTS
jgi:hypothetical protein